MNKLKKEKNKDDSDEVNSFKTESSYFFDSDTNIVFNCKSDEVSYKKLNVLQCFTK